MAEAGRPSAMTIFMWRLQYNPSALARFRGREIHTDVNSTTMVQTANFFGLSKHDAVFIDLFNRVFHNFCEQLSHP